LPLIHKEWIVDIIEEPLLKMVSAEEIFDMSIEEITEVAVREENPCIKVDFTPPD
jgi:hypothetical protein